MAAPFQMNAQEYAQLPEEIHLAEGVRALDRFAIDACGIEGFELMSKAARFAFHVLLKSWPDCQQLIILCGGGNNAGDGYILASLASKRGIRVYILYASPPDKLAGDALKAYHESQQFKVPCQAFDADLFQQYLVADHCIIVDALLGTGLNAEVRDHYADIIRATNHQTRPVLAIDIPSGLSTDTGMPMGIAIRAQVTATFIGIKLGLLTGEGRSYAGKICYSNLDLAETILQHRPPVARRLDVNNLLSTVLPRQRTVHKGHCGHVLIIGGNKGFGGAVMLASQAAARMGAGLSSVITQPCHRAAILSRLPEVMVHCPENLDVVNSLISKADVIVIGPGLGTDAWSEKMLFAALNSDKPLVLDADALNILAAGELFQSLLKTAVARSQSSLVMTPHPGEAARLLGTTTAILQSDRLESLKALHNKFGGNIVLKGSGSLILTQQKQISLCPYGNPGMASGGMGDVLSGMIGSLIAQGFDSGFALQLAVTLHARAADIASACDGERGLLASDLIADCRRLLNGILS
jgi:NAD(P)H-hydrate epimerase